MFVFDGTQIQAPGLFVPRFRPLADTLTINSNDPIARGLELYTLFNGNDAGYDIAGRELLTVGSGIIKGIDSNGPYVKGTSYTDANSNIATRDFDVANWDGLTVALFLSVENASGGYSGVCSCVNAGDYKGKFHLSRTNTTFILRMGNTATSVVATSQTTSFTGVVFVCGTWDKSTQYIYSDYNSTTYTPELTVSSGAQTTNAAASTPENYIGYISRGAGRAYLAPIYLTAIWNRYFNPVEVKAFYDDPLRVCNPTRPDLRMMDIEAALAGRIMSSLVGAGGLASDGGIAGSGGGLAG